jgi:hypothetical protein
MCYAGIWHMPSTKIDLRIFSVIFSISPSGKWLTIKNCKAWYMYFTGLRRGPSCTT